MIEIQTIISPAEHGQPDEALTMSFHEREKCRQRTVLDSGEVVGLLLPRGTVLRPGDQLRASDGRIVSIQAAEETVSELSSTDPHLLARACYHLGNRHVALQIEPTRLRYLHDHVLDDMLRGLGLSVTCRQAGFVPELGAYAQGHAHASSHEHGHSHAHAH